MKGNKLLLIVIIVLVVVIAGGGIFAFMMLKGMTKEAESPIKAETEIFALGTVVSSGGHGGDAEPEPLTFINNIYLSKKIIKISMEVQMTTKDLGKKVAAAYPAEAKAKMVEIKDIINMIISSKTEEQLGSADGKEKLKEDLKHGIEEVVGKNRVVRINFVEFIMQ